MTHEKIIDILSEEVSPDELHPSDIEAILNDSFEKFESLPKFNKIRKLFRCRYNELVDSLTEKRGFTQFNYL